MRKSIFILFLTLTMLFAACTAEVESDNENTIPSSTMPSSAATVETTVPFDLPAYQSLVSSCVVKMDVISKLYEALADCEIALWESYDQLDMIVSADKLIAKAWEIAEQSEISKNKVEQEQETVLQMYREIVSIEVDGGEGKALEEVFNQYFDAYLGLLNLVNEPVSEYDTFVASKDSYSATIKTCKTKLEALLP